MNIAELIYAQLAPNIIVELPEPEIRDAALTQVMAKAIVAEQLFNQLRSLSDEERKIAINKAHAKLIAAVHASSEDGGLPDEHGTRPDYF